jgi:C-terminal binding protein
MSQTGQRNIAILGKFSGESELEQKILGIDHLDVIEMVNGQWEDVSKLKQYQGFLCWHDLLLTPEVLDELKDTLKGIVRIGAGYDNVAHVHAAKLNIPVSNVPDYGVDEVADSTICHMLNLLRKNSVLSYKLLGDNPVYVGPTDLRHNFRIHRVSGKQLGVIGLGCIGSATALRAKAFGMKVVFYDPYINPGLAKSLGVTQVDTLDELLATSDVVTLHCFLDEHTRHIINRNNVYKIKKGGYIINTARGPLIEEEALVQALTDGHLLGAALDVQEIEPYEDGHLKNVPNLILTPHSAFYSEEGYIEMRQKAAEELRRHLDGTTPKYRVN